jgi:hypothetical protein
MRAPRMIPFLVVLMSVQAPAQSDVVTEHSTQISATAASGTSGNGLKTTICEVVANPDSFDGKMIELRGDVSAGLETNILYDGNCRSKGRFPDRILFETADVPKAGRTFVTPDDDSEYRKFWNLVGAYKEPKGKRRSIVPDKYTVTATVIGRFDALTASHAGGKLVLKSVRDVVARPFDESFMAGAEADKPSSEKKKPH